MLSELIQLYYNLKYAGAAAAGKILFVKVAATT